MREKIFTAREMMNKLRELDERLYEKVLDTISEHYDLTIENNEDGESYFCWSDADDGHMMMYIEGEA